MNVDGTGVCKIMSNEAQKLIKDNTTYKERNLVAIENNCSVVLLDKILNGSRNYTKENSLVVVALFQKAIQNKNQQIKV
jgi:hypothetical protein